MGKEKRYKHKHAEQKAQPIENKHVI